MKAPLSWLKDYVDLDGKTLEEIGQALTMIGLEVEEIQLVGLEKPEGGNVCKINTRVCPGTGKSLLWRKCWKSTSTPPMPTD